MHADPSPSLFLTLAFTGIQPERRASTKIRMMSKDKQDVRAGPERLKLTPPEFSFGLRLLSDMHRLLMR
jgi:hypothetical protein